MSNTALNTIVDNAKQAMEHGAAKLNPYPEQSIEHVAYELGWEGEAILSKRFDGQMYGILRSSGQYLSIVPRDQVNHVHDTIEDAMARLTPLYWTKQDSAAAQAQGWDLFEASLDGKPVMLIERCDEQEVFENDNVAVAFVQQQAADGEPLAIKALELDTELAQHGTQFFNAGNESKIGDLMMSDILGEEAEGEGPEWDWVQRHASFSHIRNGEDGIWEFLLNMSRSFDVEIIPEKLLPVITEARAKGLSYVLIHNGT